MKEQSAKLILLLVVYALVFGSPACRTAGADDIYFGEIEPPDGQVLRYITGTEPETLDPQLITGVPESRIAVALFDGLVEFDEQGINPIPSIATSWEPNENGTVWTFNLRQDAKWTDGQPLNAHDFVYSWRRAASPDLAAPYASFMYVVRHAQGYNTGSAFVRDPATGKFATEEDLARAGKDRVVTFTADAPETFDSTPQDSSQRGVLAEPATYLFVPADETLRAKLVDGDPAKQKPGKPELKRFIAGKELVPVAKEHVGVEAVDDYTFRVTLEAPTAFFTKMILHQFFRPVPRQAIERFGDKAWIKPSLKPDQIITSGGFRLVEWTPYDRVVVARNTFHWDAVNTKLERIVFPTVEDVTTTMNLYKAGEVDAVQTNSVPTPWRNQMKETKRDFVYGPVLYVEYIGIKTTQKPFDDPRVRRALSLAINRQVLADRAPGRMPLTSFSPKIGDYIPSNGEEYNPEQARRLLAEAGFPDGKGFPQIEILYNTNENNKQNYEIIQAMLKRELNIPVELTNQEFRTYLANTRASKLNFNGLARHAWLADFADPYSFLELLTSGSENNHTGWKNPEYDRMVLAANATTDPAERARKLADAEAYALSQQPMIPLFVNALAWMRKPYVRGMNANMLDQHNWRRVYIDHNWRAEEQAARLN